ncbi:MAG TPA: FCD domain-containing protein [Mycobacteriales bacterium]|nr:FCD domain-containing protein [Mycobacteriales bacterium]
MPRSGRPVRVPKTAELVAAQLRRRIIKGELSEGEALPPEAVLMEQFGVSRPTLREAFRVLEAEALITVRRGVHGGARVHAPDGDVAARYAGLVLEHRGTTLEDVYRASAMIEPPCAALLARTRTKSDLKRLREVLARADDLDADPFVLLEAQQAFHHAMVELARNQTMTVITGMLRHIIDLANEDFVTSASPKLPQRRAAAKSQQTHAQLIDLIEAGDAEGAADLWRRHLEAQGDHFRGGPGAKTVLDLLG